MEVAVLAGNPGVVVSDHAPAGVEGKALYEMKLLSFGTMKTVISSEVVTAPPSRDTLAFYKQQTLEWVNMMRGEWMLEPLDALPVGSPRSTRDCVVFRALPHAERVDSAWVHLKDGGILKVPAAVNGFITSYDAGGYPELEVAPPRIARYWKTEMTSKS